MTHTLFAMFVSTALVADAQPTVAAIERLPRTQRLRAYETAIGKRGLSDADRFALIKAFAGHAKRLSPFYAKTKFPFDQRRWISILELGFKAARHDADIAQALSQIYVNQKKYDDALPVVTAFHKAHPNHHHAAAWLDWCKSGGRKRAEQIPTFPVHFCVLTRNPAAGRVATLQQCRKECEILNATFRTLDGQQLVCFVFKGFSSRADISATRSELINLGDSKQPYGTDAFARAFNACKDPRVRDPRAINFYIYDSFSEKQGFKDTTSHGKRNSNRPYVLIDWQRLNNQVQNPEAHEMGHAFGLEHVGVPGATLRTDTNIMTSVGEKFGSGGRRNLGFTEAQSALIFYHAGRTAKRLGLAK